MLRRLWRLWRLGVWKQHVLEQLWLARGAALRPQSIGLPAAHGLGLAKSACNDRDSRPFRTTRSRSPGRRSRIATPGPASSNKQKQKVPVGRGKKDRQRRRWVIDELKGCMWRVVCSKVVCERECLCDKDECERWCVTMLRVKNMCEKSHL